MIEIMYERNFILLLMSFVAISFLFFIIIKVGIIEILILARRIPIIKLFSYSSMKLLGIEIPLTVKIGKGLELAHWANGLVIHPNTIIKNNVKIYPGVTIGRSDIYKKINYNRFQTIEIGNNVIFCAGSKFITDRTCVVEPNVILGANSVLINKEETIKTGVYVGIPAKRIKN